MKLDVVHLGGRWWIVGDEDASAMGPYDARADAEADRRGVARFHRHEDDPEFVLGEKSTATRETLQ